MLLKAINLKSFLLLFFIGFSLVNLTANNPEDDDDNDTGSPFGSPAGKLPNGSGGGGLTFCSYSDTPIFEIQLGGLLAPDAETMDDFISEFPCLLYVGITDQFGNTSYVELWPWDFNLIPINDETLNNSSNDPKGGDGQAYYNFYTRVAAPPIDPTALAETPCEYFEYSDPFKTFTYELEFFCHDEESDTYTPIQYCSTGEVESEWEDFLSPIIGDSQECSDNEDDNRIIGNVDYRVCCSDKTIIRGRSSNPITTNDENFAISLTSSYQSTEVIVNRSSDISSIVLTDIAGRTYLTDQIIKEEPYSINHSNLQTGLYFVTIISGDKIKTEKIVIN